jgi:hypothetical protein
MEQKMMSLSEIGALADLCRAKGINFIKLGDVEFGLLEHVPPVAAEKPDRPRPLPPPPRTVEAEIDELLGISDLMHARETDR